MASSRYPVDWAPAADRDLGRIREYIHPRSPSAFRSLARRIVSAADRLTESPEVGVLDEGLLPHGAYRYLVVPPYRLYYRFDGARVVILRCWDSRRNPADLKIVESDPAEDEG